ncbi:unnamed protein product [Absidia cylindrospora]
MAMIESSPRRHFRVGETKWMALNDKPTYDTSPMDGLLCSGFVASLWSSWETSTLQEMLTPTSRVLLEYTARSKPTYASTSMPIPAASSSFSIPAPATNQCDDGNSYPPVVNLFCWSNWPKFYSEAVVAGIKTLMLSHGKRPITGKPPLPYQIEEKRILGWLV